jgi:hypothetical protein
MEKNKTQFGIGEVALLTAGVAVWIWFLMQLPEPVPVQAIVVFSSIALAAGFFGHVAYVYLLTWRGTVVVGAFLIYCVVFLIMAAAESIDFSESLSLLLEALVSPARELYVMSWISMSLKCLLPTLLLAPAHPIRPSLPTAIMTSLGVAAWFVTGLVILGSAG